LASRWRSLISVLRYRVRSRSSRIGFGGTKLLRNSPCSSSWHNHCASEASVLRPGTFLTCAALHKTSSNSSSSTYQTGFQYTPAASIATCLTPSPSSQSRNASRSLVIVEKVPISSVRFPLRSGTRTHAVTDALCTSSAQQRSYNCSIMTSRSKQRQTPPARSPRVQESGQRAHGTIRDPDEPPRPHCPRAPQTAPGPTGLTRRHQHLHPPRVATARPWPLSPALEPEHLLGLNRGAESTEHLRDTEVPSAVLAPFEARRDTSAGPESGLRRKQHTAPFSLQ